MREKIAFAMGIFFLLVMVIGGVAWAGEKECADCPKDKPCWYTEPAGDGCNTCSGTTWCENNKWYTAGLISCTLAYYPRVYEIPKPYKDGVCENICEDGYTPDSMSANCKCIIIPR